MRNSLEGKRVLVAGASGFVGTNLVKALSKLDCTVSAFEYRSHINGEIRNKGEVYPYAGCDLLNIKNCHAFLNSMKDIYCIFMCAANTCGAEGMTKSPADLINPNIIMNVNLLKAAYEANVKKCIFVSSNAAYYNKSTPVSESEAFHGDPLDCYFGIGWVKRFIEKLMQFYAERMTRKMTCIALRSANLYGPYDHFEEKRSHVIPALIKKVVDRQDPIDVWGNGQNIKDFLYVEDFVDGMILAADKLEGFHLLNIGSGEGITPLSILDTICEIDGYERYRALIDTGKPSMIGYRVLDVEKIKKVLGFVPKTEIKGGLKKTMDWYKMNRIGKEKINMPLIISSKYTHNEDIRL